MPIKTSNWIKQVKQLRKLIFEAKKKAGKSLSRKSSTSSSEKRQNSHVFFRLFRNEIINFYQEESTTIFTVDDVNLKLKYEKFRNLKVVFHRRPSKKDAFNLIRIATTPNRETSCFILTIENFFSNRIENICCGM